MFFSALKEFLTTNVEWQNYCPIVWIFTTKKSLERIENIQNCPHDFRENSILERPNSNTNKYGLKSFRIYGAKIWNILPNNYKSAVFLSHYNEIMEWLEL